MHLLRFTGSPQEKFKEVYTWIRLNYPYVDLKQFTIDYARLSGIKPESNADVITELI